jgi:ATP-dependent exoDNAse (exonuclease V) beta subunit
LRQLASKLNTVGLDVDQHLDAFEQMVSTAEIAGVLRRTFYQPPRDASMQHALGEELAAKSFDVQVHNERRFAVRHEHRLFSGVIDRLVLLYDQDRVVAADVLDFKTDSVRRDGSETLDQLVEYYRPQLEAYRCAVAGMYGLSAERVAARLVFVSPGVVRNL